MREKPGSSSIIYHLTCQVEVNPTTLSKWQKQGQSIVDKVPQYDGLLEFLNLRGQASEALSVSNPSMKQTLTPGKKLGCPGKVASFAATSAESSLNHCILWTSE